MRLTVLGSSASYAGPGQACSGHLVEGGGARVLLDCGNGVLANLAKVMDPASLDAVFVSHYHPDHFLDLFALQALLRYAPTGPAGPIVLYLPEGLWERMHCLLSERGIVELQEAFTPRVLVAGTAIPVGGLRITPTNVVHTDPTFAFRVEGDGATLVYTSDTAYCDAAFEATEGADFVLAEATMPQRYEDAAPHLTAAQAAEIARRTGAQQLVLAHVWPTNNREQMVREAAEVYPGAINVATEFDSYEIPPRNGAR